MLWASPLPDQLFNGEVSPHLPGEASEGVLLLGQLQVQLRDVSLCLQVELQAGLQAETWTWTSAGVQSLSDVSVRRTHS